MMEHFKSWVVAHRALAAGGALALVALLYLWLRGGSAPAANGSSALQAFYGAQASAAQGASAEAQSTNALAASTGQTNAARDVALAQVGATQAGIAAQLQAHADELNLTAYHDYLAESTIPTTWMGAVFTGTDSRQYIQTGAQVAQGDETHFYDVATGKVVSNAPGGAIAGIVTASSPFSRINWNGPGSLPVVVNTVPKSPPTFRDFTGGTASFEPWQGGVPLPASGQTTGLLLPAG